MTTCFPNLWLIQNEETFLNVEVKARAMNILFDNRLAIDDAMTTQNIMILLVRVRA